MIDWLRLDFTTKTNTLLEFIFSKSNQAIRSKANCHNTPISTETNLASSQQYTDSSWYYSLQFLCHECNLKLQLKRDTVSERKHTIDNENQIQELFIGDRHGYGKSKCPELKYGIPIYELNI